MSGKNLNILSAKNMFIFKKSNKNREIREKSGMEIGKQSLKDKLS